MMAVLMPTNRPSASTNAPPELPGLMAASVWIKFSYPVMSMPPLPRALTIPIVTVWPTLKGLPMASTVSPTSSLSLSLIVAAGRPTASIFSTATSVGGSVPTMWASNSFPFEGSATFTFSAFSTTWLAVRI